MIKPPTNQLAVPKQIDDSVISEGLDDAPLSWSWFQVVADLGQGTFGKVFKVKALRNHKSSMSKKGYSNSIIKQNTRSITGGSRAMKEILQGSCYVIKEVDTSMMGQQDALEAMQEIEIIAELDSPYIVGYIDSFIDDTKINIIMEFCAHGDLEGYIKKQNGKPLIENFVWKMFIQLSLGLQYLHSRGIIHRDLKSLNIFMSKDNSVRIGDLGGAKRMQTINPFEEGLESLPEESPEDATPAYKRVGTPFFAPPEIWEEKELNMKSDIWSLGVILYHMCTQKFPFVAQTLDELVAKVTKEKPAQIPHTVKREFQEIILKCLQKKPEQRPTIEEIILSETFQKKAKLCKISLPPELNQDKIEKLKAKNDESTPMHSARPSTSGTAFKSTMETFQRTNSQSHIGFGQSRTGGQQISVGNLSDNSECDSATVKRSSNSFCGQSMLKQFQSGTKPRQEGLSAFKRQNTMSALNDSTSGRNQRMSFRQRKLSGTGPQISKETTKKAFGGPKRSMAIASSSQMIEDKHDDKPQKKPSLIKKIFQGLSSSNKNGSQTTRHADISKIDRTPAKAETYLATPAKKAGVAMTPGLRSNNKGIFSNRPSMGNSSNPSRTQSMYVASSKVSKESSPFEQKEKQGRPAQEEQSVPDLDKLLLEEEHNETLDKLLQDNQLGVLLEEEDCEECLLVETLEDDKELDQIELP